MVADALAWYPTSHRFGLYVLNGNSPVAATRVLLTRYRLTNMANVTRGLATPQLRFLFVSLCKTRCHQYMEQNACPVRHNVSAPLI